MSLAKSKDATLLQGFLSVPLLYKKLFSKTDQFSAEQGSERLQKGSRRRPTFPSSCPDSIIGAEGLNFRVRNGNGCIPLARATAKAVGCLR